MLYSDIIKQEPITKGWSCDKKYYVTTTSGTNYLLRITPRDKSEARGALFDILHQVAKLGIPMCKPVEFGTCKEGVYTIHTWIDGEDAEDVIKTLSPEVQYAFGIKAGKILKQIHQIPAPVTREDWYTHFNRKTDHKIKKYRACGVRFEGDDKVIAYLMQNREIIKDRPQTFQHGDYHIGNMMMKDGELIIIDFDRFDFGDPWEEFNRIVWCAQAAPFFAAGMVDGYFEKAPPMEFWKCLAFYIGSNTLSSIYWAIDFGENDLAIMKNQAKDVLSWYHNFETVIPSWYANIQKAEGEKSNGI